MTKIKASKTLCFNKVYRPVPKTMIIQKTHSFKYNKLLFILSIVIIQLELSLWPANILSHSTFKHKHICTHANICVRLIKIQFKDTGKPFQKH